MRKENMTAAEMAAYNRGFNDALDKIEALLLGSSKRREAVKAPNITQPAKEAGERTHNE